MPTFYHILNVLPKNGTREFVTAKEAKEYKYKTIIQW